MKKKIASTVLFICIIAFASAQQITDTLTEKTFKFCSDKIIKKNNKVIYQGNVNFKNKDLEVIGAKKAVYNQKTKAIIFYDYKDFTFKGTINLPKENPKTIRFEYILGKNYISIK